MATQDLNGTFRAEFLNRFAGRENIFWFDALSEQSLIKIVEREFRTINQAYSDMGIKTEIAMDDIKQFVSDQYDKTRGARGLPGIISKTVDAIIINQRLIDPTIRGTLTVIYNREKQKLEARIK
jgi:ATP-dependent Clp protease ATP-binding subunit ClpB